MRVLVVDDDPLTRKLMSRMLTRLGCKVSTAENGEIAHEMIIGGGSAQRPTPSSEDTGAGGLSLESTQGDERFAVVFLDNQMPVLSGLDLVAKLREMGRRDFIVGVTGTSGVGPEPSLKCADTALRTGNALLTDQQEYLDAGVDQYVVVCFRLSSSLMRAYSSSR